MDFDARTAIIEKVGRIGQRGALTLDDLQRRTGTVAQSLADLYAEFFRGPRAGEDALIFTIDARASASTYNILTSAQASAQGLGAVSNLAVYSHGQGFVLDYYTPLRHVLNAPAATPPNRMGNVRLYAVDDNRTIFQMDADGISQEAVITVTCFPSKAIPANGLKPSVTGASRGPSGYVLATSL